MTTKRSDIGVYMLAGGKSSRMGADKGLVNLQGKPMLQHGIEVLQSVFSEVTLVSNNPEYLRLGLRVIPDLIANKGPMGGIYTGLCDSPFEMNFFVACDMPFIRSQAIEYVLAKAKNGEITLAGIGGKSQPLFGIYPKIFREEIKKNIDHNQLKMMVLIQELKSFTLELDVLGIEHDMTFANINTPEDLARMQTKK
ncbi:molybdenum cofactor guanylyltransferase [Rhodonellum sp.]|uniref:molybdenum cofactor guanylyltransferase n=1 Tax=Rhodonellum sp. TaxID=2231180 RepID=UPI002727CC64|nr:molybdenum cofactor guanylyltransferase [Rhodonellum sp.]MDO9553452.1 molybdenum cofactor guanylyltransferase [Rhodonellum sp.]